MSRIKLGCAPIAWVNDDMPVLGGATPYQQILSEIALAGYEGTEVGNKYPTDVGVLTRELSLRGLRIAAAWHGCLLTTGNYAEEESLFLGFVDRMTALGADCINICEQGRSIQAMRDRSVFDDKPVFDDEEWDRLAEGLNRFGALASRRGIRLVYHHHMGTGVQTGEEIDRLMAMTDPASLGLLVDNGHLLFAGESAQAVVDRHRDRIGHVHLKDIRPEVVERARAGGMSFLDAILAGVFTVPGDGPTDFSSLVEPLVKSGYDGWFMVEAEQDPDVADPLEYALLARRYLAEELGV
ncbi:myo-inosose-2 dehydratase [Actinomyces sp. B33]|uniref:myo-inosose-2 dehydratase n=1 Tax=Actinomyces sp. B33 TaxID=2942131 RepID=UPI00233F9553|nr:myo-inosose-2 dehydratase [Actinomyces sp. B33]MDC4232484.1 myo-inosose-2 dehydratase [Actinomyces sp. B33]